jgi:hypothetical protein
MADDRRQLIGFDGAMAGAVESRMARRAESA